MFKINQFQMNALNALINASKCCVNVILKNVDMLATLVIFCIHLS